MSPTTSPARDRNLARANPSPHGRCSVLAFPTRSFTNSAGNGFCHPSFGRTALTISELITPDARRRVGISMFSYLVVAIGGALESVARFWLSGAVAQRFGETFPAGTLLVNISGSL